MLGYQHKKMGVAAGIGVLSYTILSKSDSSLALCMLTTPFGAMLPDIDHDRTKLGSKRKKVTSLIKYSIFAGISFYMYSSFTSGGIATGIFSSLYLLGLVIILNVISKNKYIHEQLGFITKHRGIMHTLIPIIFFIGTTFWITNDLYVKGIYGLCLGYIIHLLGDASTTEGVPIVWPLSKKFNFRYLILNTTNKKHIKILDIVCNMWCCIFIALGIFIGLGGV